MNNTMINIIDEKIDIYESLKNNLIQYEDFIQFQNQNNNNPNSKLKHSLISENYILKAINIKLKNLLTKILKNKEIDIKSSQFKELTEIFNINYEILYSEDLFFYLQSQALLIENLIS